MNEKVLSGIERNIRQLSKGSYIRYYRGIDGRNYPTSLHKFIADLLHSIGINYETGVMVLPRDKIIADFAIADKFIFISKRLEREAIEKLTNLGKEFIILGMSSERSDLFDHGARVINLNDDDWERLQTIFVDDPSFNFDYAHILPHTQKCSVMHGHTSAVLVEIVGKPMDGMVMDFGAVKEIVREAVKELDHKLFINRKYITRQSKGHVTLSFKTVHGDFQIVAPRNTTVLLDGEATVENLARYLLKKMLPKMPENIIAVGVYVYEGLNKGTHMLAYLHTRGHE